jgi:hypothetical protein
MTVPHRALTAQQRTTIMNQQFGKQAADQAEKLFNDALTVGNFQAFTEKGVVATQEFYAKTVIAVQDNAKALTEVAETAWGSIKMLNNKIVQNLTSNVEVAFATAQAMATANSLSEIAEASDGLHPEARYASDGADERICRPVGARHSARVREDTDHRHKVVQINVF